MAQESNTPASPGSGDHGSNPGPNHGSGRKGRPCPRGLYDGCPIPRELCTEDFARTGSWHCLDLIKDFESYIFPTAEEEQFEQGTTGSEIESLEDLLLLLQKQAGSG